MALLLLTIKKKDIMKLTETLEIVGGAILVVASMFAVTFVGAIIQG